MCDFLAPETNIQLVELNRTLGWFYETLPVAAHFKSLLLGNQNWYKRNLALLFNNVPSDCWWRIAFDTEAEMFRNFCEHSTFLQLVAEKKNGYRKPTFFYFSNQSKMCIFWRYQRVWSSSVNGLSSKRVSWSDEGWKTTCIKIGYSGPRAEWSPDRSYNGGRPFLAPMLISGVIILT